MQKIKLHFLRVGPYYYTPAYGKTPWVLKNKESRIEAIARQEHSLTTFFTFPVVDLKRL